MNPFEKISNYQLLSRLSGSGTVTVTSHERIWLKSMLNHPAALDAFEPATLEKLLGMLEDEGELRVREVMEEKAGSVQRQIYHPLLRQLRRSILRQEGLLLTYQVKNGSVRSLMSAYPHKLEYSMVKREWYLLWYNIRGRSLMSTKLRNMMGLTVVELPAEEAEKYERALRSLLTVRKQYADMEVLPRYNMELSRILYAFSCFDKDVHYDEEADQYRIRITFQADEAQYVLTKLRFLGKRVKVVGNSTLQYRMAATAVKALRLYGIEAGNSEST
ncbi:WYL domain-containing protein [Paenibacillus sp. GCM10023252]|uniref:WYL domain-containing protein n=1 Tax=Paenibacillus sp. GCM10023252 TaxID=3252649 RepID=UPI0036081945